MRKIRNGVLVILASVFLCVLVYVAYVVFTYYRIEDYTKVEGSNPQSTVLKHDGNYSIVTYNIGFGAYDQDYTFFMDSGMMLDGTKVSGKQGKATSEENVIKNTDGSIEILKEQDADFYFLQEVDTDSDRSYHVNQYERIRTTFIDLDTIFASNFHSSYLLLPLHDPHGRVNAGLVTMSNYKVEENIRRQYIIDTSFPYKYMDLDRCFLLSRVPLDNGKELVLINSHMSAYDEGGLIRVQQLEQLNQVMQEEYEKGNYVIVGGDFNHDIANSKNTFASKQQVSAWIFELSNEDIYAAMHIVVAENAQSVPTCRAAEIPYEFGVNYTAIVDGFIVSDNIEARVENIDTQFQYSDHNPVKMTFKFK